MLVLSRRKTEQIRIGDEIIIKVIDVKGGTVRIGIDAPAEIPIIRSELLTDMVPGRQANGGKKNEKQTDTAASDSPDITVTNHN
ncbi:MAG: carbon storage regulator [Planctomycetota bacterium]